ncbi:hypothetical protein M0804_002171 [Polistes exclamans]|nr:hypothetical protein M0804_002171 [Polistes exclamans]
MIAWSCIRDSRSPYGDITLWSHTDVDVDVKVVFTATIPSTEAFPKRMLFSNSKKVSYTSAYDHSATTMLACSLRRYLAKCGRLSSTVFLGTLKCTPGINDRSFLLLECQRERDIVIRTLPGNSAEVLSAGKIVYATS